MRSIEVNFSELKKTGVTRGVLWQEYLTLYPDGYSYSQFCYHLSVWAKKTDVVMHLEYKPAELIMIDFAGKKLHYTDADTGEVIPCEVFVAILPYSGLIFCIAVSSQKTIDFVWCINSMLFYFGGVSKTMLGDNLKTLVKRVYRYEPEFTGTSLIHTIQIKRRPIAWFGKYTGIEDIYLVFHLPDYFCKTDFSVAKI